MPTTLADDADRDGEAMTSRSTATDNPGTTRRTLIGAGLGALVAMVGAALGRPQTAQGADGNPVIAGQTVVATLTTTISQPSPQSNSAFQASSKNGAGVVGTSDLAWGVAGISGAGDGVVGSSSSANGVKGTSDSGIGVQGRSNTEKGVYGYSNFGPGVYAYSGDGNGMWGYTASENGKAGLVGQAKAEQSAGAFAENLATGTKAYLGDATAGVLAVVPSAPGLFGVVARAGTAATALSVEGKAKFNRSGRASVAAGRTFVDVVVPGGLSSSSLVLATPLLSRAGVYVQAAVPNPATGRIRIQLNKVASSSSATPVAWFVID